LGDTIEEIAAEKSAIIKRGSDAVTGTRDPAALAVISRRAEEQGVALRCLDRDFFVTTTRREVESQQILLCDSDGELEVQLRLGGDFQALNAAIAFGAARALQHRGIPIADAHIVRGLEKARVPGRFEIVSASPVVLLDGAHNPAAMLELRKSLDSFLPLRRIVLLFAAMEDKDVKSMAAEIGPRVDVVVTTRAPGSDRATPARALAGHFDGLSREVLAVDDPTDGLRVALAETGPDDVLVVAGSLYLDGWARMHLVKTGVGI
jgi:dihydrofolate synthase/folylpolyglutamate synthase